MRYFLDNVIIGHQYEVIISSYVDVRGVDVFHGVLVFFFGGGDGLIFLLVGVVVRLTVVLLHLHQHAVIVVYTLTQTLTLVHQNTPLIFPLCIVASAPGLCW